MKIKRLLSLVLMLTLVLVLTMLPIRAEAATVASGECGDNLTWVLDDKGTLTISGTGPMYDIPYLYASGGWSGSASSVKKVMIGNGITSIGDCAFYGCASLTSVTIPDSVTSIGDYAFYTCSSLTSVTIPNNIPSIGDYAFCNCTSLTSVTIPDSVTSIGEAAFYGCKRLTSVTIPNRVTSIGEGAFAVCTRLKSVTISNSVTSIGDNAFRDCESLTSVTIPASVTSIGDDAFSSCDNLISVTIPASVTSIGDGAFAFCIDLTGIHVDQRNPNYSSDGVGVLFDKKKTVLIQAPVRLSGSFTIPSSVTSIGDWAFSWCESLTSVIIPNSVISIGEEVFASCESLKICYAGTQQQWNQMVIATDNDDLKNANIHFDNNTDHKCDTCSWTVSECADKNNDGNCDVCGKAMPIPVPEKPYKIANVVSGVHVYWKATEGAAKYGLWRSETGKNGTYKWVANPTVPHFTDTKVTSGKTYYYKVTAMSAAGTHGEKSEAIGVTYVSTPDITSRFNKAAGITVGWNKIQGATGYAIYRKSYSGNDAWVRVGTISGNATFTWQDTSVKNNNGTAYKYTVRALAGSDMKTLSGCRNAGRSMVRLTSRTLSSAVKASATSIKCGWNTSSAVTGYEVRFMVGSTVYKTFTVGNYKTGVKTFTGLESGKTYKIQVRSYFKIDGMGFYSAWSEPKNVKLP